jgi:DNA replication and repair protein RecF
LPLRLLRVETSDFRNLAAQTVELSPRITVLFGANGQGKTNVLEACFLLCTLRPLRAQKLSELVRFGAEQGTVTGSFELPGGVRQVNISVTGGKRTARVDGKAVRDPDELFGGLAVVAFTPDDLALVKGGPEGRRRLLDRAVQNRQPAQLADTRDYLRALRSRNQLLREGASPALHEAFEEPLARIGARLRLRREKLLDEMREHAVRAFAEVARGEEPLQIAYLAAGRDSDRLGPDASAGGDDALAAALLAALRRRFPRDRERGYTSVGPHADDLSLSLGNRAARLFASQGQARAVVLAFKIGEIENLRRVQGRAPLLLLDDVSSELDPERNEFLMRYLRDVRGQVVLTTTDPRLVAAAAAAQDDPAQAVFLRVQNGRIERASLPKNN